MNALDKRQVYAAVRRRYEEWYGQNHMTKGSCLYWTMTGMGILLSLGYRALIQAGSMSWPIIPPHLDDGKQPTHFTYEWSPNKLPKMVWHGEPNLHLTSFGAAMISFLEASFTNLTWNRFDSSLVLSKGTSRAQGRNKWRLDHLLGPVALSHNSARTILHHTRSPTVSTGVKTMNR